MTARYSRRLAWPLCHSILVHLLAGQCLLFGMQRWSTGRAASVTAVPIAWVWVDSVVGTAAPSGATAAAEMPSQSTAAPATAGNSDAAIHPARISSADAGAVRARRAKGSEPRAAAAMATGGTDTRQEAGATVSGTADTDAGDGTRPDALRARILARIQRARYYPDRARQQRQEGRPVVQFGIRPDGMVIDPRIVTPSGHPLLDEAALTTVRRAAPLPYLPGTLTVPIRFDLR